MLILLPGKFPIVPKTALIVVDMLNTYDHPDADKLSSSVEQMVPNLVSLIERARDEDVVTIYVNDNWGAWKSERDELIESARNGARPDLVEPILPREDDLFVVKARHSTFYQTPLEYLLDRELEVDRIVLAGQVTEQCILYSALDAYIRHLSVVIPDDAVAHIHEDLAQASLRMMERNMDAEVTGAADITLASS
jgi:nicotinamidase-related amidase